MFPLILPSRGAEELVIVEDASIVEGMSFVFPISMAHRIIDEVDKDSPSGAMTLMITPPSAINCNLWPHAIDIGDDEEVSVAKFTREQLTQRLETCYKSLRVGTVVKIM